MVSLPPMILGGPNFEKRRILWGDLWFLKKSGGTSLFWGDVMISCQCLGGPIYPFQKIFISDFAIIKSSKFTKKKKIFKILPFLLSSV